MPIRTSIKRKQQTCDIILSAMNEKNVRQILNNETVNNHDTKAIALPSRPIRLRICDPHPSYRWETQAYPLTNYTPQNKQGHFFTHNFKSNFSKRERERERERERDININKNK